MPFGLEGYASGPRADGKTEMIQAYKYVLNQDTFLDSFVTKFPDLASKSRNAKAKFHQSALGDGYLAVLKQLDLITGGKSEEYMAPMEQRLRKKVKDAQIPRDYAIGVINQVAELKIINAEDFAVTIPAEDVLSTLLTYNEDYRDTPSLELTDGWTQLFSSRDHPKAKGADFIMKFPASWKSSESPSPNIVRIFRSQTGHGSVLCNIQVRRMDAVASLSEKNEFFSLSNIRNMAARDGERPVLSSKEITMSGEPAGLYVTEVLHQNIDVLVNMRMTRYCVIIEDKMVIIDFMESSIGGEPVYTELDHQEHQDVFKLIAMSFANVGRFRND